MQASGAFLVRTATTSPLPADLLTCTSGDPFVPGEVHFWRNSGGWQPRTFLAIPRRIYRSAELGSAEPAIPVWGNNDAETMVRQTDGPVSNALKRYDEVEEGTRRKMSSWQSQKAGHSSIRSAWYKRLKS